MFQRGSGSDMEQKMADLDMDFAEESSGQLLEKEDGEQTVQHMYFEEEGAPTNEGNESSGVDFADDVSEATTSAPVCKTLPSGHIMQVSKQKDDDGMSIFTSMSKFDKKDKNFSEKQYLGVLSSYRQTHSFNIDRCCAVAGGAALCVLSGASAKVTDPECGGCGAESI